MTLPRWGYGDPAKVAEVMERYDCTGCRHMSSIWGVSLCEQGRWTGSDNMRRCEKYERGTHGTGET